MIPCPSHPDTWLEHAADGWGCDVCREVHYRAPPQEKGTARGLIEQSLAYAVQGMELDATRTAKQALALEPKHFGAKVLLIKRLQAMGLAAAARGLQNELMAEPATRTWAAVLGVDVPDPTEQLRATLSRAETLLSINRPKEALEQFEEALRVLTELGRDVRWVRVAEQIYGLDPSRVDLARSLARVYLDQRDPARALGKLQACFRAAPTDLVILDMLGEAFEQRGETKKMASVLEEMAKVLEARGDKAGAASARARKALLVPVPPAK
jgi:tetratricopeptide (TPR) repeat protein